MALNAIGSSGLDVNGIVAQLMQIERRPLVALQRKEAAITDRMAAVARLQGATSALQTAAATLARADTWNAARATVSGSGVSAAVTSASNAALGTYEVKVTALATSHALASEPFSASTEILGNGTLTLEVGSSSKTITIDTSNNSLAGIRDAINAADAGVRAAIVSDGGQVRLTLAGTATGAANAIRITVHEDGTAPSAPENQDAVGLSRLTFDASIPLPPGDQTTAGRQMRQTRAQQDAAFEINGLQLTSASNTVTGVIEGVTLQLKAASATDVSTVTVERDRASMRAAVDGFVKAYNDLTNTVAELTRYDPTTRSAAVLNGDSVARSLQSQVAAALRVPLQGGPSDLATLSDAGIELGRDGRLSVNGAKFDTAAQTPERLSRLFTKDGDGDPTRGLAVRVEKLAAALVGTEGLLPSRTKGLQSRIDELKNEQTRFNRKLDLIETRLRKQYSALDAQLAAMQNTSNSLANALSGLAAGGRGKA